MCQSLKARWLQMSAIDKLKFIIQQLKIKIQTTATKMVGGRKK